MEAFDEVNNFDVLKRMSAESKDVKLCTTVTELDYTAKKGTKVTVGVPGNVVFDIRDGKTGVFLLLVNWEQFEEMKRIMRSEGKEGQDGGI